MSLVGKFATVGGATMASRVVRLRARGADRRGPRRRAGGRRLLCRLPLPQPVRRLFAEGAFNTAFIPLFAKELEGGGQAARAQIRRGGAVRPDGGCSRCRASPSCSCRFWSPPSSRRPSPPIPKKFDLTVLLTRIMFPYLFCMSLVAMLSGILNSMRRYFLAAIVPVLLNVILIAVLVPALWTGLGPTLVGIGLAWGVFASGVAQLFLLVWGVKREGFTMSLRMPR
jgi:putative peptidoglycan lipid II flippase